MRATGGTCALMGNEIVGDALDSSAGSEAITSIQSIIMDADAERCLGEGGLSR